MWRRPFLIVILAAVCTFPAFAFNRPFPVNARRGTMSLDSYPAITIDGKVRRLSVGARIWNRKNLIEMPAYLHGSDLTVNYTVNSQGDIDRVWLLTPEEASRPLPSAK